MIRCRKKKKKKKKKYVHKNSVWEVWKGHGAAVPYPSTYVGGGRHAHWFEAAASTADKYAYARLAATKMHR